MFGLADLILVLLLVAPEAKDGLALTVCGYLLGRCSLFFGPPESGRLFAFSCSWSERRPPPFWIGLELPGL